MANILILGASGEIGHTLCKTLSKNHNISALMRNNDRLVSIKFFQKVSERWEMGRNTYLMMFCVCLGVFKYMTF